MFEKIRRPGLAGVLIESGLLATLPEVASIVDAAIFTRRRILLREDVDVLRRKTRRKQCGHHRRGQEHPGAADSRREFPEKFSHLVYLERFRPDPRCAVSVRGARFHGVPGLSRDACSRIRCKQEETKELWVFQTLRLQTRPPSHRTARKQQAKKADVERNPNIASPGREGIQPRAGSRLTAAGDSNFPLAAQASGASQRWKTW